MTWTKLSDDFGDDCWTLSDSAFRLHVEGLIWSNRKLLDLMIPKEDLPRFARGLEGIGELLEAEYWEDQGSHYLISHHGMYQRTRDAVVKQQRANQLNGRLGGQSQRTPRERFEPAHDGHRPSDLPSKSLGKSVSRSVDQPISRKDGTGDKGAKRSENA
jgi:hypothetical protein